MTTTTVDYNAPPTISEFMLDAHPIRFIIGPYGSGKTTGCLMELARRMNSEFPDANQVRKTRFVVVRNTSQQLRQTVLPEIEKWLKPAYNYKVTDSTLQFRYRLADGTSVESDWMLIPLDEPKDVQRLLSLNITGGWVSEIREVHLEIIESLFGRCGRYKSIGVEKSAWYGIIGETNPPDEDSAWYMKLEVERPKSWAVFKQPGGMDARAENLDNLRDNYYQDLVDSNTPDWCDVHVHAKYGKSLSGQAVFRASFRPEYHVTYESLRAIHGYPLMVAQDFGRTPAAIVTQMDARGRLNILAEATSTDTGLEQFIQTILKPLLVRKFAGFPVFVVADPAGRQKSQISEESPYDCLKRLGFKAYAAPTNDIEPRLRAVEQLLLRNVGASPALLIDGAACPVLVKAMKFEYRYRRKQAGELDDKPEKTHPASDIADCLQYAALGATGNYSSAVIAESRPRPARRVSSGGWT
jgi:hypothetical protein